MKKRELTPWFPSSVKPARQGVYRTRFALGTGYSLWTGRLWMNQRYDADEAALRPGDAATASQEKRWCGLKEPK